MNLELLVAEPSRHQTELAALNAEYLGWVAQGLHALLGEAAARASAADNGLVDLLCGLRPPQGRFYLLRRDGQPAGMGGLRRHSGGWGEVKRLYLRPACRGQGLASALLAQLLRDAEAFGFTGLRLDTAPFMHEARRLYLRHGFQDCDPHAGSEVPAEWQGRWQFMQRPLRRGDGA